MSSAIRDFLTRGTAFARKFPDAVLAMEEPELAVEPNARSRHLRSTCQQVRERMHTTAQLELRRRQESPDLFAVAARRHPTTAERQTA